LLLFIIFLSGCNNTDKKNRLVNASSPYLLQHADNPIDWYEWSDEAMAAAKKENKPLLISIGYASCHWCHVMEKESFMDTAVARIMNENFICIKVDREERPDIDNIYMNACQLISGGGGWPLNAFALPDGKPFFAGTYYSKPGWMNLLKDISKAYKEKHDLVVKQADGLTKGIADEQLSFNSADNADIIMNDQDYQKLFDSVYLKTDTINGGLKGSPKFPMPAVTEFLLQNYYFTGNKKALDAASISLNKMALGGIYDHLDGGFARYATDNEWHIPHFEKMLYDNAQLISLYAHAYQITQNDFYKTIITETISFIERNLASPYGGYYSSLNADTEDGEGEFYAWKEPDFNKIAGSENLVAQYFNVSPMGNWNKGNNILFASYTPQEFAILKKQTPDQFISLLNKTKKSLLEERNKRNKPAADTKILTAWNAMMIRAYADAYTATGAGDYLAKAIMIAKFLEKNMLGKEGSLKRNFKDGKTSINGFLDDYAWTASAFIKLYSVSFDIKWITLAKQVSDYAIKEFYSNVAGLFYYTAANELKLVVRKMEIDDEVIPSSNSIMAGVLYSLGVIYDDSSYRDIPRRMLTSVVTKVNLFPVYHAQWCSLAGLFSHGTYEVAVMGKDAIVKNKELQKKYLPDCVIIGETDKEQLPLLENKLPKNKTLIYVCTNKVCKKPVENVAEALTQIK
jgi:uncharacterized protein YyaL (SSP411 family)